MSGITIGADPELFLRDGDAITSAIGLIGGDKYEPRLVTLGAVQEDNVLAEFNIDPAISAAYAKYPIRASITLIPAMFNRFRSSSSSA